MSFKYITLTRKEYARLKKLAKSSSGLPTAPHEAALVNNRLISRTRYGAPQSDEETPYAVISSITQEGKNYLLYRKQNRRDWWWSKGFQILNLFLALIAAASGIIALLQ